MQIFQRIRTYLLLVMLNRFMIHSALFRGPAPVGSVSTVPVKRPSGGTVWLSLVLRSLHFGNKKSFAPSPTACVSSVRKLRMTLTISGENPISVMNSGIVPNPRIMI